MKLLLLFLFVLILLILIILVATYVLNLPTNDYEKHSAYECGFEPFGDARSFFDIHFYTIGLLFIIFDLEIVFLIPVVVNIKEISFFGFVNLLLFFFIIIIGFYYEWALGLLNWIPKKVYTNMKNINVLLFFNIFFENIDFTFLILCILIIISLLFNQLNNLVYRIINLATLSLLIIILWIYNINLIFIFIVYILAFIGAVIMLFLSVVLMLPSSVITKNVYNFNIFFGLILFQNINLYFLFWFFILFLFFYIIFILLFPTNQSIINLYKNYLKIKNLKIFFYIKQPVEPLMDFCNNIFLMLKLSKHYYPVIYWYDFFHYIWIYIERPLSLEKNKNNFNKNVACIWGHFFDKFFIFFNKIEISERADVFPLKRPMPFIPFKFKHSLFNILNPVYKIQQGQYLEGDHIYIYWLNRLIFIKSLFEHIFINIILTIYTNYIKMFYLGLFNVIKHVFIFFSIYFISIPYVYSFKLSNMFTKIFNNSIEHLDNLLAIKYILFEQNPFYLTLSILILLIALIGAAIFTKNKNDFIKNINIFFIFYYIDNIIINYLLQILIIIFIIIICNNLITNNNIKIKVQIYLNKTKFFIRFIKILIFFFVTLMAPPKIFPSTSVVPATPKPSVASLPHGVSMPSTPSVPPAPPVPPAPSVPPASSVPEAPHTVDNFHSFSSNLSSPPINPRIYSDMMDKRPKILKDSQAWSVPSSTGSADSITTQMNSVFNAAGIDSHFKKDNASEGGSTSSTPPVSTSEGSSASYTPLSSASGWSSTSSTPPVSTSEGSSASYTTSSSTSGWSSTSSTPPSSTFRGSSLDSEVGRASIMSPTFHTAGIDSHFKKDNVSKGDSKNIDKRLEDIAKEIEDIKASGKENAEKIRLLKLENEDLKKTNAKLLESMQNDDKEENKEQKEDNSSNENPFPGPLKQKKLKVKEKDVDLPIPKPKTDQESEQSEDLFVKAGNVGKSIIAVTSGYLTIDSLIDHYKIKKEEWNKLSLDEKQRRISEYLESIKKTFD